jgi:hypothetical protein
MSKVAVPGGLSYEIIPGGEIVQNSAALGIRVPANPKSSSERERGAGGGVLAPGPASARR